MLREDDRILVALSGGKDSMALVHQLVRLGLKPHALHIDLDIEHSSFEACKRAKKFCTENNVPLKVVHTQEHGLNIPLLKKHVNRPVCSFCGKIKRYLFNKYALDNGYTVLATGHNLDDETARLMANTLRWDTGYLRDVGPVLSEKRGFVRKIKPLYRLTEFELANYCYLNGIAYNMRGCPYSFDASFNIYKNLLNQLEKAQPGRKRSFYEAFQKKGRPYFARGQNDCGPSLTPCLKCGYPTSEQVCGVCRLKEELKNKTG